LAELAGKTCVIKVSGAATTFVGEATTASANKYYQITDTAKQVLDRTATIRVHKYSADDAAEASTTTTNIKMTGHGLVAGDLIINTTRANAARLVTVKVDNDNVTVAAVTGQTEGDTIVKYPTEAASGYTLNRLNGKVTYAAALSRTIKVSGSYLPMSTAAYANDMSRKKECDLFEITDFGDTNKKRMAGLLSASGTVTQLDLTDTTYADALTAGVPVVLEDRDAAASEPNRTWVLFDSDEIKAAVNDLQNEPVSWVSYDSWLTLGS
jgi:hypothetical protein